MAKRTIRPIRIDGDIAYIPLTRGYEAIIDAADAPLVSGANWYSLTSGHTIYAARSRSAPRRTELLHRCLFMGDSKIDHINGDGLDNRRCNLRNATHAENMRNARKSVRNTSGVKGVSFNKASGKWVAYICIDRLQIHLGTFGTIEDAKSARAEASAIHHGPFSRA